MIDAQDQRNNKPVLAPPGLQKVFIKDRYGSHPSTASFAFVDSLDSLSVWALEFGCRNLPPACLFQLTEHENDFGAVAELCVQLMSEKLALQRANLELRRRLIVYEASEETVDFSPAMVASAEESQLAHPMHRSTNTIGDERDGLDGALAATISTDPLESELRFLDEIKYEIADEGDSEEGRLNSAAPRAPNFPNGHLRGGRLLNANEIKREIVDDEVAETAHSNDEDASLDSHFTNTASVADFHAAQLAASFEAPSCSKSREKSTTQKIRRIRVKPVHVPKPNKTAATKEALSSSSVKQVVDDPNLSTISLVDGIKLPQWIARFRAKKLGQLQARQLASCAEPEASESAEESRDYVPDMKRRANEIVSAVAYTTGPTSLPATIKTFDCTVCGRSFYDEATARHESHAYGGPRDPRVLQEKRMKAAKLAAKRVAMCSGYVCRICYTVCKRPVLLAKHLAKEHSIEPEGMDEDSSAACSCQFCPLSFSRSELLQMHIQSRHSNEAS